MTNKKISALTSATTPLAGTETVPIVQSGATVKATIANIVGAGTSPGSFTTLAASDNITQSDKSKTTSFGYQETLTNAASTASLTRSIDSSGNVIDRVYKATGATYALYVHTTGDADQLAYTANADGSVTFTNNVVQGTAAKGVNFTANTPAAGMTSQLLNWYEEGTWTPTQGGGLTVVGTFSSSGRYTRIGRLVQVAGVLNATTSLSITSASILCAGLPFPSSSSQGSAGTMTNGATLAASGAIYTSISNIYAITTMSSTTQIAFSVVYFV